jgi:hypothetical protein
MAMETPLDNNDSYRREEIMAVQIIMLQLLLLLGVYLFFKTDPFQSSQKNSSFVNDSTVSPSYSSRNIVDIMWSCQPNTIFPNGERSCASHDHSPTSTQDSGAF